MTKDQTFKHYIKAFRPQIKFLYEQYLTNEYTGTPYSEFAVKMFLMEDFVNIYGRDVDTLLMLIENIEQLTLKQEKYRDKCKEVGSLSWRHEHYVAMIMLNRSVIKSNRACIKRILENY